MEHNPHPDQVQESGWRRWFATTRRASVLAGVALFVGGGLGLSVGCAAASDNRPFVGDPKRGALVDFIITNPILTEKATYEELGEGPVGISACLGATLSIGNASRRIVGLTNTPWESDATFDLGIVQPGGVVAFKPDSVGSFVLSDAETGNLLFRYDVEKCSDSPDDPS